MARPNARTVGIVRLMVGFVMRWWVKVKGGRDLPVLAIPVLMLQGTSPVRSLGAARPYVPIRAGGGDVSLPRHELAAPCSGGL
jgi:hypothetical protein